MRHTALLSGEASDTFIKVLTFFEKVGVVDSIASWQLCRSTRNLAAHDYGTDYALVAEHFNALHELVPSLYSTAARFVDYCHNTLGIHPATQDFAPEFEATVRSHRRPPSPP
jgi:hypothetical protein